MERLVERLKAGESLVGPFSVSGSATLIEVIGYAGFDFVIIDCEHAATGATGIELEEMVRAAYAADIIPVVRTTRNDPTQILKAFNFGAQAVITPHCNSRAEAEAAVRAGKYAPVGRRSSAPPVRAAKHGFIPWVEFYQQQLDETLVIPLIEEPEGLAAVDDIASVDGLGGLFFGPFDLAVSRGQPGGVYDLETHKEDRARVYDCAKQRGLPIADLAWDLDSASAMIKMGCQMVALGTDITMFANSCRDLREAVDSIKA